MARSAASRLPPRLRGRRLHVVAATLLGAAALMLPSFLVGHPDVFPDTSAYHLVGQWLAEQAGLGAHRGFGLIRHRRDLGMFFTMAGARSPYYGLFLYATSLEASAWATIAVQALCASALVALTLRVVLRRLRLAHFAGVIAVLTLASTLPFFVSFVMPDVFLGLGALSAILLLFFFDRLRRWERWALGVFTAVTLTFHTTNPPAIATLAVVAGAALLARALPARPTRAGLAIIAGGLVASVAAAAVYKPVVEGLSHRELSRPPFLSARLLADGPGRIYLRRACAEDARSFVLCRWRDLPLDDANDILWATRRTRGVFEPADHDTRLALTREEPRFVAAVVRAYPLQVAQRLAIDSFDELTLVSVVDTLGYGDRALIAKGPAFKPPLGVLSFCVRRPFYCDSTPLQLASEDVLRWTLIGSAAYLVARLCLSALKIRIRGLHPAPLSPRMAAAVVAVLTLLVANAVLCGALSGVYARYEMRVAWLAPLFAMLTFLEARLPVATLVAEARAVGAGARRPLGAPNVIAVVSPAPDRAS